VPHDGRVHTGVVQVITGEDMSLLQQEITWTLQITNAGKVRRCEVAVVQVPIRVLPILATTEFAKVPLQDITAGQAPFPSFPGEARFTGDEPDATWPEGFRCVTGRDDLEALIRAAGADPDDFSDEQLQGLTDAAIGNGLRFELGEGGRIIPEQPPVSVSASDVDEADITAEARPR